MAITTNVEELKERIKRRFDKNRVMAALDTLPDDCVAHAQENGTYKDRTGTLRHSIRGKLVEKDGKISVKVWADAPYARYVENKGYNVLYLTRYYLHDEMIKRLCRL